MFGIILTETLYSVLIKIYSELLDKKGVQSNQPNGFYLEELPKTPNRLKTVDLE